MGIREELIKPVIFDIWKLNDIRKQTKEALENASKYLWMAENFVADADKLQMYRGKIDEVVGVLSFPDTAVKNVSSAVKIMQAVFVLKGDIRANSQRSAKAFGKLFSGVGELASYLPFPINFYLEIFAEAENFFENVRIEMDPQIHVKKSGSETQRWWADFKE